MTNPVQKAAMDWEANAIEKCRNDPEFMAMGLCPVCVCMPPCLCDKDRAVREMRAYYEANRRIERKTIFGDTVVVRDEPKSRGSWGSEIDDFMRTLYKIAVKRHAELLQEAISQRQPDRTNAATGTPVA